MLEGLQKVEVFKRCNKELIENISNNILIKMFHLTQQF